MQNAEPVRPAVLEESVCCICSKSVDVRKFLAIWPDGRLAHVDCYDVHWLSAGVAAGVVAVGDATDRESLVALGSGLEHVGGEA